MLSFHRVQRNQYPEGEGSGGAAGGGGKPEGEGKKPFAVFDSQEAFQARLAREVRSQLREIAGQEDPAKLKEALAELENLKKADKEAKDKELSEIQRLTKELGERTGQISDAETRYKRAVLEGEVARRCAALGVRNYEFALYTVERAGTKLEKGKELDLVAHFDDLLKDPKQKAALEVLEVPAPPDKGKVPVDTDPAKGGKDTPPEGKPGVGAAGEKGVLQMTAAEFAAHKSRLAQG
jgi:hypothetical protein